MTAPKLIRPALHQPRSRVFEAARWDGYAPRPDDIVVATYSKCGTTWMQHIVSMLVFKSAEPRSVGDVSPWPDFRFMIPKGAIWPMAEAHTHRRFFKTHLPLDALPFYEGVKYVHVARDGRDAALSLHNHLANFTPQALAIADKISLADPMFATPFPRTSDDARAFFHDWVAHDQTADDETLGYFHVERSYWAERKRLNILFVHYNDLKADLGGEMRRVANFLGIEIDDALWPALIEAASFEAMRKNGDKIMPYAHALWEGGPSRFLHKGTNGRWRDLFAPQDLEAYDRRVATEFPPALARWVEHGRRVAGDPKDAA